MEIRTKVKCPYCGTKNMILIDSIHIKEVVTCEVTEGGCDRDFVADAFMSVSTSVFKIEGEEDHE